MQNALVTGGSGFVGSHLVDRLLHDGYDVTVLDNQTTGHRAFLPNHTNLELMQGDVLDDTVLRRALEGQDIVFHLSANADIRHGAEHPGLDVIQNVVATQKLLEAMRQAHVRRIMFASSGAIYGNPITGTAIPENLPFPRQTSFYGASKLAAESLISAYCEAFDFQATICRFVPMLGERYSHGHIYDFTVNLIRDNTHIDILGDGQTNKYCVYVGDAIEAVFTALANTLQYSVFNIGNNHAYTIDEAVSWVAEELNVTPERSYTGKHWAGDNVDMRLDCSRINALGWNPTVTLREAVHRTVAYLIDHPWMMSR